MSRYGAVVKMWQDWNVRTVDDLALRLDSFRILFAYNSGKIENAEINYHDTREILKTARSWATPAAPAPCLSSRIKRCAVTFCRRRSLQKSLCPLS